MPATKKSVLSKSLINTGTSNSVVEAPKETPVVVAPQVTPQVAQVERSSPVQKPVVSPQVAPQVAPQKPVEVEEEYSEVSEEDFDEEEFKKSKAVIAQKVRERTIKLRNEQRVKPQKQTEQYASKEEIEHCCKGIQGWENLNQLVFKSRLLKAEKESLSEVELALRKKFQNRRNRYRAMQRDPEGFMKKQKEQLERLRALKKKVKEVSE